MYLLPFLNPMPLNPKTLRTLNQKIWLKLMVAKWANLLAKKSISWST